MHGGLSLALSDLGIAYLDCHVYWFWSLMLFRRVGYQEIYLLHQPHCESH